MAGELTEEEKAARRHGLGASDAGGVFGYGYRTPLGIWLDKVYGAEVKVTPQMQRGHDLEALVAEKASGRFDLDIVPVAGQIWHPDIPWLFATLDYATSPLVTIVECKTTEYRHTGHEWGPDDSGPDGVPAHVLLQAHHQMAATGADRVIVATLFVDTWELRTYTVEQDPDIEGLLLEGERRFWEDHVVARVPPAITRPGKDLDAVKGWPLSEGATVVLPAGAADHLAVWAETNEQLRQAKARQDEARAELAALIGEAETATLGGTPAVATSYNRYGSRTYRLLNKRQWRD